MKEVEQQNKETADAKNCTRMNKNCCHKGHGKGRFIKKLAFFAVLGSLSIWGFMACKHSMSTPEKRLEWFSNHIANELNLDANQKTTLTEIKQEVLKQIKNHDQAKGAKLNEIKEIILADKLDDAKITILIKSHQSQMDEMVTLFLPKITRLHEQMSKEQKQKLIELLDKFAKKHHPDF